MARWRFHASHLACFERCGEQFRRRYIEGEIIPPGIALITGIATHRSIEVSLRRKVETGELPPVEEVQDAARDCVVSHFRSGDFWIPPDERKKVTPASVRDRAIDTSVALASLHRTRLAPELHPTEVERPWVVRVKGYPFDLAGTFDCVEGHVRLRDAKTRGSTPAAGAEHRNDQYTMYLMAYELTHGTPPADGLWEDNLVQTKTPKLDSRRTQRSKRDYIALLNRIAIAWRSIEAGVFPPSSRSDYLCSPRWCGYYETCPYARGRTVHAVGGRTHG